MNASLLPSNELKFVRLVEQTLDKSNLRTYQYSLQQKFVDPLGVAPEEW